MDQPVVDSFIMCYYFYHINKIVTIIKKTGLVSWRLCVSEFIVLHMEIEKVTDLILSLY